jgi:C-terminal processing protease CtpA/Prc
MKKKLFMLSIFLILNLTANSQYVYKAELDKEFEEGTTIKVDSLSDLQTNNLYKLAKIWGFIKYYHPYIAKGALNWDNELFRILPIILKAESEVEAEKNMFNWLQKILITKIDSGDKIGNTPNVKQRANTAFFKDKTLKNKQLKTLLLAIETVKKPQFHYYIGFVKEVGNPFFSHELTYKNLNFKDDGVKLLGLFRYWNIVNYFFPYRYLMDDDWDKTLKAFIPKIIQADDNLTYKLCLLTLVGKVQDTHANIVVQDETLYWFWGSNKVPIEVKMIENQVVVTHIYDSLAVGDIRVGDVITAINNQKITERIEDKIKYCPASNRPTQLRNLMEFILRTNEISLDLAIEGKGNQHVNCVNTMIFQDRKMSIPAHKLLDDNIGYIYPASLQRNTIDAIMQKYMDTKGIIIDLRCYPADFIVYKLGKYLMPSPREFVKFTSGNIDRAGDFEMGKPIEVGILKPDYYKGKIAILINEETLSQAEYSTMAWRVAPKATVIGSTTAGADGNISPIILPGNISTYISGIGVYYPDGKETQRVGIVPDIECHPTINGIKNGLDELLNKAIEIVRQK